MGASQRQNTLLFSMVVVNRSAISLTTERAFSFTGPPSRAEPSAKGSRNIEFIDMDMMGG